MELSKRGSDIRNFAAVAASAVKIFSICAILLCAASHTFAAIEVHEFESDLQRQRYQSFIEEMRCPKCQNQNLAGSDAPVSADLRNELYEMIKLGKSDKEIVDFMVERYGDFILYRPRVTPATYFLWGTPISLLVIGAIVLGIILRRRRQLALVESPRELSTEEQTRLKFLLESSQSQINNPDAKAANEEPRS